MPYAINGLGGADTMAGGLGNDLYFVDNIGDGVTEATAAGTDTVLASISYTLTDNVENLALLAGALTATGNALANTLTGNAAANTLSGLAGIDTLVGNGGSDLLDGGTGADTRQSKQSCANPMKTYFIVFNMLKIPSTKLAHFY